MLWKILFSVPPVLVSLLSTLGGVGEIELISVMGRENRLKQSLEGVRDKYDFIITNPPIRAGKKVIYEILFGAKDYLKENNF